MPLSHGYGLVIGTKQDYFRDPADNFGRYYHGNLIVRALGNNYKCAIDVDPKALPDGIQWRVVTLRAQDFAPIRAMPNGWHLLDSDPTSGALDYPRSLVLHPPRLFQILPHRHWWWRFLNWLRWNPPWNSGTGIEALTALEGVLDQAVRCYVFGEPFSTGYGVHNIHQNQGDPIGSPWAAENGIWQDGATIVEKPDGRIVAFLNKFKTQSFKTDDFGHPV
jgi:Uncharacterized conserved protein (DUF2278)